MILVGLINELLCVDVALEVVRDQVVITMLDDAVDQSTELASVAESPVADRVEDAIQLRVKLEAAVEVVMAQVLDVFCEIAEEEDVVLADFASDLVKAVSATLSE